MATSWHLTSLTVLGGTLHGKKLTIEDVVVEVLIGSDSDCHLHLDLPTVSPIHVLADALTQKVTSLAQHVTELWSVRAGKSHTVVDGASFAQSKTATILTEGKVAINGKEIHLG
jgi:hypothetical protein